MQKQENLNEEKTKKKKSNFINFWISTFKFPISDGVGLVYKQIKKS